MNIYFTEWMMMGRRGWVAHTSSSATMSAQAAAANVPKAKTAQRKSKDKQAAAEVDAARMSKASAAKEELERLLDVAVKEYEDDFALKEQKEEAARAGEDFKKFRSKKRAATIVNQMKEKDENKATEMVKKILEDMKHPEYGDAIQNVLNTLSGNTEGVETVTDLYETLQMRPEHDKERAAESSDMDYVVASTMRQMSQVPKDMSGLEPGAMEQTGEDIMTAMIAEFERLSEKEDYGAFIEGNLRQLLSRDIMYHPVKQICDRFPEWLAVQEETLPREEYIRFGRMYQHFQKMVACYETEPDNFSRLVEIMHDMQEFGQPPADIIKELAPGLDFNHEGLPVMPNLGGNVMPHMPNVPFPDSQVCLLM